MDPITETAKKMFRLILLLNGLPSGLLLIGGIIGLYLQILHNDPSFLAFAVVAFAGSFFLFVVGFVQALQLDKWEADQRASQPPLSNAVQ